MKYVVRPASIDRAEKHLEGITDGILLVLKGHLLLEEALYQLVKAKCSKSEYLDRADLGFYRLLQIARAIHEDPADDKRKKTHEMLWDGAEALNTLRNKFAHSLEPTNLAPLLQRLHVPNAANVKSLNAPEVLTPLGITIALLIGMAGGLAAWTAEEKAITP